MYIYSALITGPGDIKDQFYRYLLLEAERRLELELIIKNKSRFVLAQTSSGNKHALEDVLARACCGPKHVEVGHEEYMATQTLLITDDPFRNADIPTRRKLAHLVKSVKDSGGTARIFSSMHVSGGQLALYSGIAAVLRFPLPDLEHIEV
ncbi:protein PELOTA 2 [Populus alba]|uniref:Protein PELOTA 2-like n=2 Tax=Populus alba x Populus x berolinensis TaxID=444605 RepID=A0AAD6R1B7_9ROSI|nr:protein PELOTA 2-like [Populus alba]KAJ7000465.1 protein PELOTA 2-like [Populus alba x Populus x berolinensis]